MNLSFLDEMEKRDVVHVRVGASSRFEGSSILKA